ncbi:glutathionylspermidine synthase family protein [Telmatospirillum sp. J64-1]|uniref:glutathionylspermidine synthase family protein n=1 Tax=Telmatospirillum sp. J64-1 TaxID=2502183 RepID=UPI00115D9031|nr:glutathionylspermidine synthase family protein [Telmatospirillum sp. J64-1]
MKRIPVAERPNWRAQAEALGFSFHSVGGQTYWDESAYYQFTLRQIEDDLEAPTAELEQMCFAVVERALGDNALLSKLGIPAHFHDYLRASWGRQEKNLYGRMDFAYDGTGPAKLLEYNADTPTSLYESATFQWIWLEQAMEKRLIPHGCDQYNSIHEHLVDALSRFGIDGPLHVTCARNSSEDRATVAYLADCAEQAGLEAPFLYIDEIGVDPIGRFTDVDDTVITHLFKLYPWEWIMGEEFAQHVPDSGVTFIEPAWKLILSSKGLLPLLWEMFEGHPNLLPAYFEDDPAASSLGGSYARKPLFSREGANVELIRPGSETVTAPGPYGAEGYIRQALHPLPEFDGNHTVIGSWTVASQPCGIGIREDSGPITRDTSRFLPHVILD